MHFKSSSVANGRVSTPLMPGEWPGNTARIGDTLAWYNPNTGMRFGRLEVAFVYTAMGSALMRGWFGVMNRKGERHIQSQVVRLEHCVVTERGAR